MPAHAPRSTRGETAVSGPLDVLYIAGMGRSGSTLLERLLGELVGICSLGEVAHLWKRGVLLNERCGCGTPFLECPFWSAVGERAFGGWSTGHAERMVELAAAVDDVARVPRLLRPGHGAFRAQLDEYVAAYEAIYRAAGEVSGRPVIVDSSKYTSLAYALRTSPRLRLQVVHAVRDSRGVAYSWTKRVRRPEARAGESEYMATFSPVRLAVLWSGHNVLVQAMRLVGTPVHLATYERFIDDPGRFVTALMARCGIPLPAGVSGVAGSTWVQLGVSHQVAGNPMRYQVGRIPVRADEAWREALPARQRRLVTLLTAPVALLLGYRPAGRRAAR